MHNEYFLYYLFVNLISIENHWIYTSVIIILSHLFQIWKKYFKNTKKIRDADILKIILKKKIIINANIENSRSRKTANIFTKKKQLFYDPQYA